MNLAASKAQLIGLDWGTSSLRAYLIGKGGAVLDTVSTSQGIMQVKDRKFRAVFGEITHDWQQKHAVPVIAAGMITSRNGWVETPYLSTPAGHQDLANSVVAYRLDDGAPLYFVTGMTTQNNGAPDVMRGEETQIIGAVAQSQTDGTFVMPGTHSKWVQVQDGQIIGFKTFMTGELFAALKNHTILGTLMQDSQSKEGFEMGVHAGLQANADLLHRLFHVRSLPLFEKIAPQMVADYLSGLLIGAEINATRANINAQQVTIIGRGDLAERYEIALRAAQINPTPAPENIVVRGLYEIAKSAGLCS